MYYKKICKCGCNRKIKIQKHHKIYGIPDYIWGHHVSGKNNPNYKEKVKLICKNCKKEFFVKPGQVKIRKFCSNKCSNSGKFNNRYGKFEKDNPMFGTKRTKKIRKKMRENHYSKKPGYVPPMKNKNHNPESKLKISKSKEKPINLDFIKEKTNIGKTPIEIARCLNVSNQVIIFKINKYFPNLIKKMKENNSISKSRRIKGIKNPAKKLGVRRKIRVAIQKRLEKYGGQTLGKNEKQILDEIEKHLKYKIIRQYPLIGYFIDGYIPYLNIAFEVDEKEHFNINGELKKKDINRQRNIEQELNCNFIRIWDC